MADNNQTTDNTIFGERGENNPLNKLNTLGTFIQGFDPTTFGLELDPFNGSLAFIYWVSLPSWFDKDPKLKYFKTYTQKFVTSFQGVTDINADEASVMNGFGGNQTSVLSDVQKGNNDFTLSIREFSGTPLTQMIERWIFSVRDPNTHVATYPERYDVEYSERNHTGCLLYILLRPDATNVKHGNIEKAILYTNVWPTNVPYGTLFNYSQGSPDVVPTVEVNFKGVPIFGDAVKTFAKKILADEILDVSRENGNSAGVFLPTDTMPGDPITEILTSTVFSDVYKSDKK